MSTFLNAHWILEIIYTTCDLVNTVKLGDKERFDKEQIGTY